MREYMELLQKSQLFAGIAPQDIADILSCSASEAKTYAPGEYIYRADSPVHRIWAVLSGAAHIISEDYWGNKFILTEVSAGEILGAVNALAPEEPVLFSAVARSEVKTVLVRAECLMNMGGDSCPMHLKMIRNLLAIVARENLEYLRKFDHMSRRTTREKLLSYFSEQAKKNHSSSFDIPFNRQQLADYLTVDRSAMSAELSRMAEDGLIRFKRSRFELI